MKLSLCTLLAGLVMTFLNSCNNQTTIEVISATTQAADTEHVRSLAKKYPNLILRSDGMTPKGERVYVGFDEGTHTTRHSTLLVDAEGQVFLITDPAAAEDDWIPIK